MMHNELKTIPPRRIKEERASAADDRVEYPEVSLEYIGGLERARDLTPDRWIELRFVPADERSYELATTTASRIRQGVLTIAPRPGDPIKVVLVKGQPTLCLDLWEYLGTLAPPISSWREVYDENDALIGWMIWIAVPTTWESWYTLHREAKQVPHKRFRRQYDFLKEIMA